MTTGYSAFLDKIDKNCNDLDEGDYADLMKRGKHRSFWKKAFKFSSNAAKYIVSSGATKEPGTLFLVRHGESTWNRNKTFTREQRFAAITSATDDRGSSLVSRT
jgi:hypothetical protein